jgi:hypothetical protein
MDFRRTVRRASLAFLLFAAPGLVLAAETGTKHSLKSRHQVGETTRVEFALQVGGDLKFVTEGKTKDIPMSVIANLRYDEQWLSLDRVGHPNRSLRYYDDTRAVIKVDQGGQKPTLDPSHRLIAVDKPADAPPILYCPTAPLTREELDLIETPGTSLLVDELLPADPVAFGDTWKLADDTLAGLLCLDAVSWSEVTSVLGEIKDGVAEIAAAGTVNGAVGGIATEIELKAKYRFDLARHRVVFLAMLVKEKRAVGHVGPGLDTVAKLIVTMKPIEASQYLTPQVVARASAKIAPELTQLSHAAMSGEYQFRYDRRWQLTSDDKKLTVLRLLDRGELVAQCNISLLPGDKKTPVTLAEFQRDVQTSLGKSFAQFTSAGESTSDSGDTVLRVVARGTVSELPIEWIYYLIQQPGGKRVTLAFTYEQDLGERFAQADRQLVRQLRFTDPPAPTAAKPVEQR